jgi:hypothetical protein
MLSALPWVPTWANSMVLLWAMKWIVGPACVVLGLVWLAMAYRDPAHVEFRFRHLFEGRLPRDSSRTQLLLEAFGLLLAGILSFVLF